MAVAMGALPSLLPKLGELLVGEYKLQKGVKRKIMFVKAELEGMYDALVWISMTPPDQVDNQDKLWARDVRALSYDIEDSVDAFMVRGKGNELAKQHGFMKFVGRSLDWLARPKNRRKIAIGIRDIKSRIIDVYLENLHHLRHLGLIGLRIVQLPEEIGSLQFLQTLDVTGNEISSLPSIVVQLKHLTCLRIDSWTRAPNGLGSLTSLEELSTLCIHDSTDIIEELGYLTELRVLGIDCHTGWKVDNLEKSLVGCLQKLPKVQSLSISFFGECNLDAWVVPKYLRRLELMGCWSSTLLARLEPLHHLDLSFVSIEVTKLQQKDLEILGMLKGLCYLDLEVDHEDPGILGRFVIGANLFPCLVQCTLRGSIGPVVFRKGAMPRLTSLCFTFPVNSNGGFDLGLGNLLSLQNVTVSFLSGGASEGDVEEAEDALRHATEIHPNHPTLWIN